MFNDKSNVYGMRTSLSMSIINDDPFYSFAHIQTSVLLPMQLRVPYRNKITWNHTPPNIYKCTEYTHEIEKKTDTKTLAEADCDL